MLRLSGAAALLPDARHRSRTAEPVTNAEPQREIWRGAGSPFPSAFVNLAPLKGPQLLRRNRGPNWDATPRHSQPHFNTSTLFSGSLVCATENLFFLPPAPLLLPSCCALCHMPQPSKPVDPSQLWTPGAPGAPWRKPRGPHRSGPGLRAHGGRSGTSHGAWPPDPRCAPFPLGLSGLGFLGPMESADGGFEVSMEHMQ